MPPHFTCKVVVFSFAPWLKVLLHGDKCSIKKNYTYGFASSCRCDSKQNINEKLFHKGYGYAQINLNSLMMRHTVKYLQRAIITQLQNTKSYFMRYLIC